MTFEFTSRIIEWRGPAPFLFLPFPPNEAERLKQISRELTYGWGCIPAHVTIGQTTLKTSIFPRQGGYLVPIKVEMQRAEGVALGDEVHAVVVVGG
ncbi:MAG: DUF1905 domain-containing protein [Fimbriimonadaceae bacterium]|nr:DUF1905 domain-containing protein [Fimbriimonadaceae bacterium]